MLDALDHMKLMKVLLLEGIQLFLDHHYIRVARNHGRLPRKLCHSIGSVLKVVQGNI